MPGPSLRDGKPSDLAAICEIEEKSFVGDRLSARSIGRFLVNPAASLRVVAEGPSIAGYCLVLTRRGSSVARLYSIAVAGRARGRRFGEKLLADAERAARRQGARALRLEVRPDNMPAIRLYEGRGYGRIGTYRQYYADGSDALRFEKPLAKAAARGSDNDEDRSRCDFGVSTPVMKASRAGPEPGMLVAAGLGGEA